MSFGFGVGDFIAVAGLAHTLCKTLTDLQNVSQDFQVVIPQLRMAHEVLLHVEDLRSRNQLATATVNALAFSVDRIILTMESFLDEVETYLESLKRNGSGNKIKDLYMRGKWRAWMPEKASNVYLLFSFLLFLSIVSRGWASFFQPVLSSLCHWNPYALVTYQLYPPGQRLTELLDSDVHCHELPPLNGLLPQVSGQMIYKADAGN